MKKLTLIAVSLIFISACNVSKSTYIANVNYLTALKKVFEKHGRYDNWQKMNALTFEKIKKDANETHYVDLKSRRDKVVGNNYTMGFDGQQIWLDADTDTTYKGNAAFYHNLYFYFYAMPFVLGDNGIIYTDAEPMTFDNVTYKGIHIAYQSGIGQVSTDEYILYYHPETFQMEWLAYTVTFKSKKKSNKFRWIRYNDWGNFNGIVLPKSLSWYKYENNIPTTLRNTVQFENIVVAKKAHSDATFAKPSTAKVVE